MPVAWVSRMRPPAPVSEPARQAHDAQGGQHFGVHDGLDNTCGKDSARAKQSCLARIAYTEGVPFRWQNVAGGVVAKWHKAECLRRRSGCAQLQHRDAGDLTISSRQLPPYCSGSGWRLDRQTGCCLTRGLMAAACMLLRQQTVTTRNRHDVLRSACDVCEERAASRHLGRGPLRMGSCASRRSAEYPSPGPGVPALRGCHR